MNRRLFFGTIGGLFGVTTASVACPRCGDRNHVIDTTGPAPKKPWHAAPYIVEVWKPFSNPDIFNAMTLGSPVFIKFDSLKQAENWALARKSLLENADVNNGKMIIRSAEGQAVQIITWGRSWCHSTVYVDGPSGWNDDPAGSWTDTDENHDRHHEDI